MKVAPLPENEESRLADLKSHGGFTDQVQKAQHDAA